MQQGHTIIGREVSYRVEGSDVSGRIDLMTESPSGYNFIEVKNGHNASFTPNQKINYPLIKQVMPITPSGNNLFVPTLTNRTQPVKLIIIK